MSCFSDGVGRTGAFVSIHAEMERMKAETVVDLFQFIKASRIQRNGLVSNKVSCIVHSWGRRGLASAIQTLAGY